MIGSLSTKNEAVTLRALSLEDAGAYYRSVSENRDHLRKYSKGVIERYHSIDAVIEAIVEPNVEGQQQLGIWDQERLVGSVGITPHKSHLGKIAEIGYWVDSGHLRQGFATLATQALAEYAQTKHQAVIAYVAEDNLCSRAVLQKSGFVFRDHVSAKEGAFDLFRYTGDPSE